MDFVNHSDNDLTKGMRALFEMPCVKKHINPEVTVQSIPSQSLKNFFLDPWAFDFSESSKYGAVGRFPSNHQYCLQFLDNGLESHREAIDVKFNASEQDRGIFKVHPWSVGFVDGQTKALLVQSILGLLIHNVSCCKFIQQHFWNGLHIFPNSWFCEFIPIKSVFGMFRV